MTATKVRPSRPSDTQAEPPSSKTVKVPAPKAPLLVTLPEAARILSVGRTALYQLIWYGELTPIHIGRSVRFSMRELEFFVERRLGDKTS